MKWEGELDTKLAEGEIYVCMAGPGGRRQYPMGRGRCGEGQWGSAELARAAWAVSRRQRLGWWRKRRVGTVDSFEAAAASDQAGASRRLTGGRR